MHFSLRVVTLGSPNWRARAQSLLQPVPVQTPAVQAWILEREAAVNLVADLRRRADFREYSSPQQTVSNGQSSVVSSSRSQYYVRDVRLTGNTWPGYQPETAVVDEGFSLEFSPLLAVDATTIDAIVKCQIDQLEKMVPVMLDVPTAVAPRQRTKIEVPQLGHFRLHERFRWPEDKVLLIGMSMIPLPSASETAPLVPGCPAVVGPGDNRAIFWYSSSQSAPWRFRGGGEPPSAISGIGVARSNGGEVRPRQRYASRAGGGGVECGDWITAGGPSPRLQRFNSAARPPGEAGLQRGAARFSATALFFGQHLPAAASTYAGFGRL